MFTKGRLYQYFCDNPILGMASLCHLLLFLQLLPLLISAQSNNNITLGSSLSSLDENPYWTSPSGDFAFGFHPHGDLFLLAIWFDKIPPKTIVWTAHGGVPVGRGARVELTSDGVLSLTAPNGTQLWRPEAAFNDEISHAAMLNTGNFVLSSSADSTFAWESFDHPTDTMLPTQVIPPGNQLSSRKTEDDYTIGRFEFAIQADGNLVLYTVARPKTNLYRAYWASDTVSNGSKEFVFNQSGYMYLTSANSSTPSYRMPPAIPTFPISTSDHYLRATLDFDGVLGQYSYPKTIPRSEIWPSSWSPIWSLPEDICSQGFGDLGSGACGFNSYCRLIEQRPECECPPGYVYIDPQNTFEGCKPDFVPQSCDAGRLGTASGFQMQEITGSNFPFGDYEMFQATAEDWCRETCLNDCFCAAAVYSGDCWLKKLPLSHGQRASATHGKTLIKVGNLSTKPVSSSTKCDGNEKRWIVPGSVVLGISIFINLLILVITIWGGRYKRETNNTQKQTQTRSSGVNLQSFTHRELEEATDGFKEELGKGAFSVVYKGVIKSDGELVAVKRLDRIAEGNDKEFEAEMMAIAKTNHKNLVQLLGFCDEEAHRILVYEFMKNGSLESFLFGSKRLDWYQRIQIAYGIARGLAYLHEDCSSHIIHCDIKPQNILLDEFYEARISDFGLAKLLKSDQTRTMTGIRGTRGYVAPEWFRNMPITSKVDVYSFGIMLLEIICCRKNAILDLEEEDVNILSDWAYECCMRKELHLLVEDDEKAKNDGKTLERLVMVSLCCIQEEPSLRPSMKMITQMLEGLVEVYMPSYASSFVSSTSV